jgi:hypothetical protein
MAGQGSRETDISIQNLVIDLQSPDVPADMIASQNIPLYNLQQIRKETGVDYIMPPQYLLAQIRAGLRVIIENNPCEYGNFLFERVGNVKILLDGKLEEGRSQWDLAEELAVVKNNNKRIHKKDWVEFKEKAYRKRVELGLPVLP